ncbi:19090_t:CDS:2 [Cetraspora pellucida]|uniref:19090_t:CDS:1 n=1 Tax=Cetraspora pellucida TaxID=1433469 RepID=A0A9N9A590_9GLOM|nr:19090_t:CDS:2 [Cetraspora pellucida]
MESEHIVTKTHIDTCAVELKHIFGTFVNDHIDDSMMNFIALEHIIKAFSEVHNDNSIVKSEHIFENHIDNSIIDSEALAKYMNNNIVGSVQTFENYIDNSILKPEHTVKYSIVVCKFDKDDLGLIKKLHDNELRTKDIFFVLASVSSKYIHKPDVYNMISYYIALKDIYGTKQDQDDEFIQEIFWAYHSIFSEFIVKLAYDDSLETYYIEQELTVLWRQFPEAKSYMCETWILYKNNWLVPFTKHNINLDIKSSQHVESLYNKLKECAQLASDTFNVPVIVFGTGPAISLLFLSYNQKPSHCRKPIILQ